MIIGACGGVDAGSPARGIRVRETCAAGLDMVAACLYCAGCLVEWLHAAPGASPVITTVTLASAALDIAVVIIIMPIT